MNKADIGRIIEMAWEDRTPFDAIYTNYGLTNGEVIKLMRRELKPGSFRIWRKRTSGRRTKHRISSPDTLLRFKAPSQGKPKNL